VCGSADVGGQIDHGGEFVECNTCGATGPRRETAEEADAAWNAIPRSELVRDAKNAISSEWICENCGHRETEDICNQCGKMARPALRAKPGAVEGGEGDWASIAASNLSTNYTVPAASQPSPDWTEKAAAEAGVIAIRQYLCTGEKFALGHLEYFFAHILPEIIARHAPAPAPAPAPVSDEVRELVRAASEYRRSIQNWTVAHEKLAQTRHDCIISTVKGERPLVSDLTILESESRVWASNCSVAAGALEQALKAVEEVGGDGP
jgi:hypothetical protein